MTQQQAPLLLMILDGFGHRDEQDHNAIFHASKPNWNRLWESSPHQLISGSGTDVGLPPGQMGNSEVGHLNLGAGRVVYQDYTRITKDIETGEFRKLAVLNNALDSTVENNRSVHIMGLLSDGGVHSHEDHIHEMVRMAADKGISNIYVHAFLDGRDTAPQSALKSIEAMENIFAETGCGQIASICGRFYAMDRDNRWERIEPVYEMLTQGTGEVFSRSASTALEQSYANEIYDEFVKPVMLESDGQKFSPINDGDLVIYMNFRADRARELSYALANKEFTGFHRQHAPDCRLLTLTEYATDIDAEVIYQPLKLPNVLGEYLSHLGKKQLRIAETEKYAHVTFFFNGGIEQPFAGEERDLIPSPKVKTYDLQPEMNAPLLTDHLVSAIETGNYDVIICNYANSDMVGHTGNFDAAVKAIETLDVCIGRVEKALKSVGGEMLITADHGNAEKMLNSETGQPFTAHTSDPVPLLYMGRKAKISPAVLNGHQGVLSDIAPTMLSLMDIPIPAEMTGTPLFEVVQ